MNALNTLVHALRDRGGFATAVELEAIRPKLKNVMKSSVEVVEAGFGEWVEDPDGEQVLRLTESCLEKMAFTPHCYTVAELREMLDQIEAAEDLVGRTIFIRRG